MKDTTYYKQADLLLIILPFILQEKDFALKGGTGINFFYRDLPRISVDIDLTYLPITPRNEALNAIEQALERVIVRIRHLFPGVQISRKTGEKQLASFVVRRAGVTV